MQHQEIVDTRGLEAQVVAVEALPSLDQRVTDVVGAGTHGGFEFRTRPKQMHCLKAD